jgi:hypothetical protein
MGDVRVGGTKGAHINTIDEITVVIHDNCWAPQMRCVRILHPAFVNYECRGCNQANSVTKTFKLIGTCPY